MSLLNTLENKYVYINSSQTKHPKDIFCDLTYTFPKTLDIDNTWQVALLDIIYMNPFSKAYGALINIFFIETDIVETNIVCNGTDSRARRVLCNIPVTTFSKRRIYYSPDKPLYINVNSIKGCRYMSLRIINEEGEPLTIFKKDISLLLHFKRNI